MDRFTKNTLLIMTGLLALLLASTYIGVAIFKGDMETKYMKVIESEAEAAHLPAGHIVELGERGEYIGFTVAGALSGLLIGYLWPSIFERGAG